MSRNQRRAIELARLIVLGEVKSPEELGDDEWALLLLAADLRNPCSLAPLVAHRVLDHAAQGRGYFADIDRSPRGIAAGFGGPRFACSRLPGLAHTGGHSRLGERPTAPLRLLVVDDHEDTARLLAHVFRSGGFDVHVAGSVASALELARAVRFDLMVSEAGLPDGDGCELLERVLELYPIRAVALSSYGMLRDRARCARAGFCQYLLKPATLGELCQAVRAAVDGLPCHSDN